MTTLKDLRPITATLILLGGAALAGLMAGLAFGGYVLGAVVLLAVILALGGVSLVSEDRGAVRSPLRRLGRDEYIALAAVVAVVMAAAFAALAGAPVPWPVIGLAGMLFVLTMYELSRPESSFLRRARTDEAEEKAPEPAVMDEARSLQGVDIFRSLAPRQLREVAGIGARTWIPQGSPLGIEGQVGNAVYVILQGQAELSANSAAGRITVRVAGPGESLPFAALLGDGTLITSVQAMTDMIVWKVERQRLLRFCEEHPDAGVRIYSAAAAALAERYRTTLGRLTASSGRALQEADFWANV